VIYCHYHLFSQNFTGWRDTITNTQVESILSTVFMFKDITLVSRLRVIRASKNSDMAVIWVDIWDSQNSTKAKSLINRSFNFRRHIATVKGMSISLGIPQCHNCWKWGHTTFTYRAHGTKCQKCGGPHKLDHHRDMAWCCKANDKTNPPRLEIQKEEPCPHEFKCLNCKGNHLANDTTCPFWKHHFNREWHTKKAQELREIQANSIRSAVGSNKR